MEESEWYVVRDPRYPNAYTHFRREEELPVIITRLTLTFCNV
jgi:hypothetical protein